MKDKKEKQLNKEQLRAVIHKDGPLLIVAGAGTGKTTVLVERLKYLIENNLAKPDEILITTFTEKAAGEMEERADRVLPYGYVELWINTFHSFCERLLRDHALDIGLPADFKLLNQTEQWMLVRKNLDKFDLDYYRPLGNPTKFIYELIKHFSRLKDENIMPREYLEYAEELNQNLDGMLGGTIKAQSSKLKAQSKSLKLKNKNSRKREKKENNEDNILETSRIAELANAYHTYNQLLLDNSFLDFGDLITYTLRLFKERPNILKIYHNKFKFIMVDEFQDTNWSQYELVKMLAMPENNLVVVGDDDQSIYKFRGASLSNIMQFKDDYPEAKEVVLSKNYRSGQTILDVAYKFINFNNPNRLEVKLGINKKIKSIKEEKGTVEHLHFYKEEEEIAGVADKIFELYRQDSSLKTSESSVIETNWSDFAILVRANDTADKFVAELTRRNIPNQFVSLRGLYYKPIILDCLAFLKLLDNYHESSALFRVLNMEVFKVNYEDIVNINKFARQKVFSTYEALQNIQAVPGISPAGVANINKLLSLIQKHSGLAKKNSPSQIFLDFVRDSGLVESLDYHRNAIIFDYLNQFYQRIKNIEASEPGIKLKDFLEMITLELEAGETGPLKIFEEDVDVVKVMTVHAAKGLEFKYVFVPCLVDKKFPVINRAEKISIPDALVRERLPEGDVHIEEERRLFYVALTRAKVGVFLTSASDYGGEKEKKISKFLEEAGPYPTPSRRGIKINPAEAGQTAQSEIKYNGLIKDLNGLKIKEAPRKQEYILPAKFSFSQLEAYAHCPLQYKFSYILKIPVAEKANFIFGKAIHSTLRDFFVFLVNPAAQGNLFEENSQGGGKKMTYPAFNDLKKIYEKYWQNDGYRSQEERDGYRKKGEEIIKLFYERLIKEGWPKVLFLEKNFTIKLGEHILNGAIDRIDRFPDGTVEIIDYKTGNPKKKLEATDKRQLIIYKIAMQKLMNLSVSRLTFYYLENGPISFTVDEKEEEKLTKEIIQEIEEIKKCNFLPKPGYLCGYCDFKEICEFRQA